MEATKRPRLTDKVLRGLVACTSYVTAGDVTGDVESGNLDSADDVFCADAWVHGMIRYRDSHKAEGSAD